MTLPVYCHYTVTSPPNYTGLLHQHIHTDIENKHCGLRYGVKSRVAVKKETLFDEERHINREGDRGHVWT